MSGKLEGRLQNPFQEAYFYQIDSRYGFFGKLDECLVATNGTLIPVDFKTASTDPRDKEILSAYTSQIDDYTFLLQKNRRSVAGFGYLVFFYPETSPTLHERFPIAVEVKRVDGHPEQTEERLQRALAVLEGPIPGPGVDCPFCSWRSHVGTILDAAPVFKPEHEGDAE